MTDRTVNFPSVSAKPATEDERAARRRRAAASFAGSHHRGQHSFAGRIVTGGKWRKPRKKAPTHD